MSSIYVSPAFMLLLLFQRDNLPCHPQICPVLGWFFHEVVAILVAGSHEAFLPVGGTALTLEIDAIDHRDKNRARLLCIPIQASQPPASSEGRTRSPKNILGPILVPSPPRCSVRSFNSKFLFQNAPTFSRKGQFASVIRL